jgi:hypothetical protein
MTRGSDQEAISFPKPSLVDAVDLPNSVAFGPLRGLDLGPRRQEGSFFGFSVMVWWGRPSGGVSDVFSNKVSRRQPHFDGRREICGSGVVFKNFF